MRNFIMKVLLLNFVGGPGVPVLNSERGPGVPLLNFRGVPGPTFKLWEVVPDPVFQGLGVLVPLLHNAFCFLLLSLDKVFFINISYQSSPAAIKRCS